MALEFNIVQLTRLQLSITIVAVQQYIQLLHKKAADEPQGGEHEDVLIAESVLRELVRAKAATKSERRCI